MKIILSPSKTMNLNGPTRIVSSPLFLDTPKTLKIFKLLHKITKKEFSSVMKIEKELLEETVSMYRSFTPDAPLIPAIELYTGLAFRSLELETYDCIQLDYLEKHLRILSAMYGVVTPFMGIWPYRLDFTHRFKTLNPATLWKQAIPQAFEDEDLIINLASEEFSTFLKPLESIVHTVEFSEFIRGQEKVVSANAKKARGYMAHLMIKHQVKSIEDLRKLDMSPYVLQKEKSNVHVSHYLKQVKSD